VGKLEDKVVLVTGGSKGIGFAAAKLFAQEGAKVIITGRNESDLEKASKEIKGEVMLVKADQGSVPEIKLLFKAISERYKKIDSLFINAGVAIGTNLDTIDEETFEKQVNINYKGAFFTAKESLPLLNKKASIVFTTSVAASMGFENLSIYSSSKAAVESLTRTLAADLAKAGIRVNAISPGYIATPLGMKNNREHYEEVCQNIPLENRFGTAEEIAKVALFLICDATYMTGINMIVDGGLSAITSQIRSKL